MPNRVCVIDMPGLSRELSNDLPPDSALGKWLAARKIRALTPSFPAVTCSVQATLTTGVNPDVHGILANGVATFRSREDQSLIDAGHFAEHRRNVSFWEQSNQFLGTRRFWQNSSGQSRWKTSLLFFQNSMPGFSGSLKPAADIVLTPKPDHGLDGKLVSLCWAHPAELVGRLFKELGPFPLMNYWGPVAGIASSQWIAKAAAIVWQEHQPQLQWVYIPHLDYDLQKFGPNSSQAKAAVRDAAHAVEPLVTEVLNSGGYLVLLSEYAIRPVDTFVQPNILLRSAGLLRTKSSPVGPIVDYEQSAAFAMVDHQIAHVFVRSPGQIKSVDAALNVEGIASSAAPGKSHRRSGDLILQAKPNAWFDYRWWTDPVEAPTFAKTVDIHRKPGYDPLELFFDPPTKGISQNASLIRGSHGLVTDDQAICAGDFEAAPDRISASQIAALVETLLTQ